MKHHVPWWEKKLHTCLLSCIFTHVIGLHRAVVKNICSYSSDVTCHILLPWLCPILVCNKSVFSSVRSTEVHGWLSKLGEWVTEKA